MLRQELQDWVRGRSHISIYLYTYIHIYVHTCIHTYMHAHIRMIHTYRHTGIHTLHTYIHICPRAHTHTHTHTHIRAPGLGLLSGLPGPGLRRRIRHTTRPKYAPKRWIEIVPPDIYVYVCTYIRVHHAS